MRLKNFRNETLLHVEVFVINSPEPIKAVTTRGRDIDRKEEKLEDSGKFRKAHPKSTDTPTRQPLNSPPMRKIPQIVRVTGL